MILTIFNVMTTIKTTFLTYDKVFRCKQKEKTPAPLFKFIKHINCLEALKRFKAVDALVSLTLPIAFNS